MTKIKFYDKELEEILNALRDREEFLLDQLKELKSIDDPTEGEKEALKTLRLKLAIVLNLQNIIEVKDNDRKEEDNKGNYPFKTINEMREFYAELNEKKQSENVSDKSSDTVQINKTKRTMEQVRGKDH